MNRSLETFLLIARIQEAKEGEPVTLDDINDIEIDYPRSSLKYTVGRLIEFGVVATRGRGKYVIVNTAGVRALAGLCAIYSEELATVNVYGEAVYSDE